MAGTNDFVPFGTGGGANVLSAASWAALAARSTGFVAGTASSQQANTAWRQATFGVAALAQLIADATGLNVVDDGIIANFEQQLAQAIDLFNYGADSGVTNAYAVTYAVPVLALVNGLRLRFHTNNANTGPSTFSPSGLTAKPIYSRDLAPLVGGEIVAGATVVYDASLAGGTGAWVLVENPGGTFNAASQVGRLIGIQKFTANGTYSATAGTRFVIVEVQAGGGGGGGAYATDATHYAIGTGGGGGAYAKVRIDSSFNGAAVVVGQAGVGQTANIGTVGGVSSFGAFVSCPGGLNGYVGLTNASTTFSNVTYLAMTAAPTISAGVSLVLVSIAGSAGGPGIILATQQINASGGSSPLGNGGAAQGNGTAVANGSGYGAGGSAAYNLPSFAAKAGGNGSPGVVIVYEYS